MKETRRYNLLTGLIQVDLKNGKYIEHSDHLKEVEQLQARIKELESAERTLHHLGYQNLGGELWKPPIGKKPDFSLIDRLNKRIEDLDLERKKAFKAGSDYFNQLQEVEKHCNELAQKIKVLESQSQINEIKAQGIEEAINYLHGKCGFLSEVDNEYLTEYVQQLRTKHD